MSLPHEQAKSSGVMPVKSAPPVAGASNGKEGAAMYRQQQAQQQNDMNKTFSGGRRRRRRRRSYKFKGGSDTVVVPQFNSPGPQVSAGGQDATGASVSSNTTMTQSSANASCDKCIGDASNTPHCQGPECNPNSQSGGSCKSSGLVPIGATWGCMSGGVRRSRKHVKSRKHAKSKKHAKSRKHAKSKKHAKKSRKHLRKRR